MRICLILIVILCLAILIGSIGYRYLKTKNDPFSRFQCTYYDMVSCLKINNNTEPMKSIQGCSEYNETDSNICLNCS